MANPTLHTATQVLCGSMGGMPILMAVFAKFSLEGATEIIEAFCGADIKAVRLHPCEMKFLTQYR